MKHIGNTGYNQEKQPITKPKKVFPHMIMIMIISNNKIAEQEIPHLHHGFTCCKGLGSDDGDEG